MTQVLSPDLFNSYTLLASDNNGLVSIGLSVLHLPNKASTVTFAWIPEGTSLLLDGELVVLGTTVVSVADIQSNLLVWNTNSPNQTILFDSGYYAFDSEDNVISLLQVYYPPDIVINITDNVVNGGNFKTLEPGQGYDTDAGDFDSGILVVNGYNYDGGDFNTGERVGVAPPPASVLSFYLDGELDPENDNIKYLLDENFELIPTTDLPNVQYFNKTVTGLDLTVDLNYTIQYELSYVTKYFEGFDYGSIIPNFGYDIDYGSVDMENDEGYDFNSIANYNEPTQVSGVS